jgi:hypothetical protein
VGHWLDVAPCALFCEARPQNVAVVTAVGQENLALAETAEHVRSALPVMREPTAVSAGPSGARLRFANPGDPAVTRARITDHAADRLGRVQQGLRGQVRVSLCHPGRGVPEQPLHDIERDALVDEQARERVTQVVQPNVRQSRAASDAIPRAVDADEARREDIRARGITRDPLQHRQRRRVVGNCPGLARFRDGYQQCSPRRIHLFPLGQRDLPAATAGEEQQHDRLCGGVFSSSPRDAMRRSVSSAVENR